MSVAPAQHLCLFNDERYHQLHLDTSQRVTRYDHHDNSGRLVGSFVGVTEGDGLVSGFRAPFGGIDLVREWEPPEQITLLINGALEAFSREGIRTVRIRCKPSSWSPGEVALQQALLHMKFQVETAELNFSIDLRNTSSLDVYRASLKKEARKALARSEGLDLPLEELRSDAKWREAFDLLAHNRAAKGRPMNLTFDYLQQARDTFPERITMIGLGNNPMVAAALIYRVAPSKAVVVRWGDAPHDLKSSPMYALAAQVVDIALRDGITMIDLGIATERGTPNHGLIQFKRAIGAVPELRLDMVREIGF